MDYLGYEMPWYTLDCSVYFDWMTPFKMPFDLDFQEQKTWNEMGLSGIYTKGWRSLVQLQSNLFITTSIVPKFCGCCSEVT